VVLLNAKTVVVLKRRSSYQILDTKARNTPAQSIIDKDQGVYALKPLELFVVVAPGFDCDAPGEPDCVVDTTVLGAAEKLIVVYGEFEFMPEVAFAGEEAGA
jgi:hypothetical protein